MPLRTIAVTATCAVLASCSMHMDVPADFLRLEGEERGDVRAVTADGARIWVREFPVADQAELSFWVEAVRSELVDTRGYELVGTSEVEDAAGREGRAIEAATTVAGERCGYLLAVFVLEGGVFTADAVRTVEFTARKDAFDAQVAAVRAAIATLR